MKAVAAYMAYKNRESENERRNEYNDPGRREYENRAEYGGNQNRVYNAERKRQPNQYTQRNEMGGYWPESNDQRSGGNGRGRQMNNYENAESRYRGRDGRWRAGRRRSEYDGGAYDNDPMDRRMGDDEDDEEEERKKYNVTVQPKNVIQWPYGPHEPPENRMIGFGAMHMQGNEHEREMEMGSGGYEPMPFDRETAEEWVRNLRNEDKSHPKGGKWTADQLKPLAQKYNIPTDGKKFWEFYAMTNAMYSDYSEVARKFGITSPEFYVCMAKAFIDDKDAEEDKVAIYYECIAKK